MSETTGKTSDRCVNLQMLRASHRVMKAYDNAYRPHGIRATQLPVLSLIGEFGPLSTRMIAQETDSERSVLSRKLAVMQKNDWIKEDDSSSSREKVFILTETGRELLHKLAPVRAAVQGEIMSGFSPAEQQLMLTLSERLQNI